MTRNSTLKTGMCAVALVAACTQSTALHAEILGKVSQPLVGGNLVDAQTREAYGLLTLGSGRKGCSGSLLRNNWAITAAHCVDEPGQIPGEFVTDDEHAVTLSADWPTRQERTSMRVITFRPLDIAIIRVADPFVVHGSASNYNRGVYSGPLDALPLTVFGRGYQQFAQPGMQAQKDGLYRVGDFRIGTVKADLFELASSANQWLAGGDSGGPAFTRDAVLVGVISAANVRCVSGDSCEHNWVASTYNTNAAPVGAAWDQIDRYLGAFVPYPTVRAVGRVKLPTGTPSGPPLSICEAAQQARARNSPAAPGLEAQCEARRPIEMQALADRGAILAAQDPLAAQLRNVQGEGPARRGFDIGMGAAEGQTAPGPGKQRTHDALSPAEQEGFRAAVSYSLARNRKILTDMAPRGAQIASEDPLAMELRNHQPEGPARFGFDVGMAVAEGQTAPGPGKDRIRDSLLDAEKGGFLFAVSYSLDRNRNVERAATGAAIAAADPAVAAARRAQSDVLHRLGFDIATAIFGDPGLGAQGNTAIGPGSMGIRNALSPSAQNGFDDAVAFHLRRGYAP